MLKLKIVLMRLWHLLTPTENPTIEEKQMVTTWKSGFGSWNPCIPTRINEIKSPDYLKPLVEEFKSKYNEAKDLLLSVKGTKSIFKDGVPLAYKLIPVIQPMEKDEYHSQKIGGLPDLSYGFQWRMRHYKLAEPMLQELAYLNSKIIRNGTKKQNSEKVKLLAKIDEIKNGMDNDKVIHSIWPRCGVCHEHMTFIGQFSFSKWRDAIHLLTCHSDDKWNTSGIAHKSKYNHDGAYGEEWWLAFACMEFCDHSNPNCNAYIIKDRRSNFKLDDFDLQDKPFDEDLCKKASSSIKAKQYPLGKITGYQLKFDVDTPEYNDKLDNMVHDHPELFNVGDYSIFGAPSSQQEPARYYGTVGYKEPYRLAPILSWSDPEEDVTHQLYGDLMYCDNFKIYGKMESSCT